LIVSHPDYLKFILVDQLLIYFSISAIQYQPKTVMLCNWGDSCGRVWQKSAYCSLYD